LKDYNNAPVPGGVFKFDGTNLTPLFSFASDNSQGTAPAGVVLGTDGALYGTGNGMVFRVNTDGTGFQEALQDSSGASIVSVNQRAPCSQCWAVI
jgi:hypothetical protein